MQRIIYLRTGTSRLYRVGNSNQIKRYLSNISKNDLGINTELYKPSTAKESTHVPDDLHSGQPRETFDTTLKSTATLTNGGKVWSVQNPGSIHIAPLGGAATTFVPTTPSDDKTIHETTVHVTQGELNFVDPLKTHVLQPEPTPGELAEAAAASAFQTSSSSSSSTDATFAPKIASTNVHSQPTSPTAHFDTSISSSSLSSDSSKLQEKDIPIQRESDIRDDILREALKYVNEKGWTMDAIRAGINASNQPTTVEGLFSNSYDLIEYFTRKANTKMTDYMNEKSRKEGLQGTNLLVDGLKYRLSLVIPYANTWDQALAQGALPQNAMKSWKSLLDLSSDAWHGIGDTSTDINWYSKRLLLAAVYKSAEIYMLQDQSIDKIDTINFLERRLNDFQSFGSVRNTISKSLSDTSQIVNGVFSVVRNLTSRR